MRRHLCSGTNRKGINSVRLRPLIAYRDTIDFVFFVCLSIHRMQWRLMTIATKDRCGVQCTPPDRQLVVINRDWWVASCMSASFRMARVCVSASVSRFLCLAPPHSVRILRGSMRATNTLDDANFGFYVFVLIKPVFIDIKSTILLVPATPHIINNKWQRAAVPQTSTR